MQKSNYWDFIADYLPCYSFDDRVLWSDILFRYLNDEEISEKDLSYIEKEYSDKNTVIKELERIDFILIGEALEAYLQMYKI